MNKFLIILLISIILLSLTSCFASNDDDSASMTDALKISAYVLDKNFEGKGYWTYGYGPSLSYWVSDDGTELTGEDVFKLESLNLNEVRVMAPLTYNYMPNLNIYFEFDGIVEVEAEIQGDNLVQLAHSYEQHNDPQLNNWVIENNIKALAPFAVNFCPIGKFTPVTQIISGETLTDREYYLNVKASRIDGTTVVTARLKLTVLDDDAYLPEYYDPDDWLYSPSEKRSRFLSIEVVSYEYSDMYKIGNDNYGVE